MHTAADIIRGLECVGGNCEFRGCSDCPWHGKGLPPCRIAVCESAIAYIQSEEGSRCIDVLGAVTG